MRWRISWVSGRGRGRRGRDEGREEEGIRGNTGRGEREQEEGEGTYLAECAIVGFWLYRALRNLQMIQYSLVDHRHTPQILTLEQFANQPLGFTITHTADTLHGHHLVEHGVEFAPYFPLSAIGMSVEQAHHRLL